jgi:hypothetical protein
MPVPIFVCNSLLKSLRRVMKAGAADWNRTSDLTLTKGVLYRLSYGSLIALAFLFRRRVFVNSTATSRLRTCP